MQITIVSVSVETKPTSKGSYQVAVVAYKNEQGKIEGKNIMSFGATGNTFKTLSAASQGEVYNITTVKNDKGYWDWTNAERGTANAGTTVPRQTASQGNASPRSSYESAEERAKKQVYIVRQSSIANAVDLLSVGGKSAPKVEDVLAVAKQFEDFVFSTTVSGGHAEDTTMVKVDEFNDEIPF